MVTVRTLEDGHRHEVEWSAEVGDVQEIRKIVPLTRNVGTCAQDAYRQQTVFGHLLHQFLEIDVT